MCECEHGGCACDDKRLKAFRRARMAKANMIENCVHKHKKNKDGFNMDCLVYLGKLFDMTLQFDGWCINLKDDGTWDWEDTTGG
jgi:hypothetical protein